jgi:hypothetical protein
MGLQGTSNSNSSIPSIRVDKGALGSIDEGRLRELRKRRNLLILLVGHEIERIVVWNNPLNRISLQTPEDQKFKYENLPKNLLLKWRDCIFFYIGGRGWTGLLGMIVTFCISLET